jgi:hypothetical protein
MTDRSRPHLGPSISQTVEAGIPNFMSILSLLYGHVTHLNYHQFSADKLMKPSDM